MDYYTFVPFWAVAIAGAASFCLLFTIMFLSSRLSSLEEDVERLRIKSQIDIN
ncbi:MAG TPA: hypothetical protein VJB92_01790 [Candidatus Paceibacterota bacterium]